MLFEDEFDFFVESDPSADPCAVVDQPVDHILIVDDDTEQVDVLSHSFTSLGYRVSVAGTRADGLTIAAADRPDLILLDICLPDGDGLGICEEICDNQRTGDIPVIIVSGTEKPDVVRKARAAGCHYYVRKPYDPNALLILAQNAIRESRDW